jgi:hypothetical protein
MKPIGNPIGCTNARPAANRCISAAPATAAIGTAPGPVRRCAEANRFGALERATNAAVVAPLGTPPARAPYGLAKRKK